MSAKLRRIPSSDVPRLLSDGDFLLATTGMDDIDGQLPWYWRLLTRLTGTPGLTAEPKKTTPFAKPKGEILELQKAWHGLHFLLTGDPSKGEPPLSVAVLGDREIGEDLAGYGAARLNSPEQVKQIFDALAALSDDDIIGNYDGERMIEQSIYPGGWISDSSWKEELRRSSSRLRAFYKRAAAAGDATLSWIE